MIRDETGAWHDYQLPTAWEDRPIGVTLIVYLLPGETLDCQTILDALKPALKPPGVWWKNTYKGRAIRQSAYTTAALVVELQVGDRVLVVETITAPPGQWGHIIAYKVGEAITEVNGWVYMGGMVKV